MGPMPTDTGSANAPRSRRGAETRARLLEAAKAVFEEMGFHEARIMDITRRAGVSHGAFYHYFDSKEDIFREVAAALDDVLSTGMKIIQDSSSAATPRERLTAAIRAHFETYRKEAQIMSVVEQVSRYDAQVDEIWSRLHLRYGKEVADSIAQLQRHGLADPTLDPTVTAAALGAMTWRFAERWLVRGYPECDFDTGVEQITRIFINALRLEDPRQPDLQTAEAG